MLTVIENDEPKWNIDFLINNPKFITSNIYQTHKNNVYIFRSYKGYQNSMLSFAQNYKRIRFTAHNGCCYFCEENLGIIKYVKYNDECHLCDICNDIIVYIKNNMNKITPNLYKLSCTSNSYIIYDAIYYKSIKVNKYIMYDKLIKPIDKFNYITLSFCQIDNSFCCMCHNNQYYIYDEYDFLNHDNNQHNYKVSDICIECLQYALKICVDTNYPKYMLVNQFDLNDVRSLIKQDYILCL